MVLVTTWEKVELETLSDTITRQMVNGNQTTLARICLSKGALVPRHAHASEQVSFILSGALKFIFDTHEEIVKEGAFIVIPSNVPHAAEALEDTEDLDVFAPRREDWIRKDDAYLRR